MGFGWGVLASVVRAAERPCKTLCASNVSSTLGMQILQSRVDPENHVRRGLVIGHTLPHSSGPMLWERFARAPELQKGPLLPLFQR